eukprot:Skav235246  [mRNA]  locus=scaffold3995:326320:332207:+ [translate_table: standard]
MVYLLLVLFLLLSPILYLVLNSLIPRRFANLSDSSGAWMADVKDATKAFSLGPGPSSLAVEGKARGVDVHAVHPSPVNSRFTTGGGNDVKVHKMNMFEMAYKMATGPEVLPNQIFAAVGRSPVMIDLGGTSIGMRDPRRYTLWQIKRDSAPAAPVKELSPEELAKLSKDTRRGWLWHAMAFNFDQLC